MKRIRTLFALVLVPVLLGGLVVGCTPPEEEVVEEATPAAEAGEVEATAEVVPPAEEPVEAAALTIGILVPFTGDLSDFGQAFFNAAQLAVDEVNDAGGVNGQPVLLVQGDTGTAPQQGTEEARRLIEVEGVSAIIGAAASGVSLPIAESVTGPNQILQISPASTSPALTAASDDDYLFRTTISDAAQGVVLAALAEELGYESVCTLFTNNAYGQGLSEVFAASYEASGGTVQAQVPHEQEQPSYASELSTCTADGPQALAAISYPESARVYLREAIEQGVVEDFLFVDGTKSQEMFDDLGAENFEGMYGTAPGALDTATGAAFDAAYEAAYGERPPLPFLRETYDAVYVISLAAQKAGSSDSTAIRDALRDIGNPPGETINPGADGWVAALAALDAGEAINYEGAASPADLDANGDVLKGAIEVWQVVDGQITVQETRQIDLTQ